MDKITPNFIAARYKYGDLLILAALEADHFSIAEAEDRADAFLEVVWGLVKRRDLYVGANNLYLFFDEQRGKEMTPSILKKCYKKKNPLFQDRAAWVWPIVVNVPAREIKYKKGLWTKINKGARIVREKVLTQAFV